MSEANRCRDIVIIAQAAFLQHDVCIMAFVAQPGAVQGECQTTVFRCCVAVGGFAAVTADSSAVMPIAASLIITHLEEIILVFGIVIFKFAAVQAYPEALVTIALTQIA